MLLAIGVFAFAGLASAATHYVPGDFATITAALAAADPGDTIVVRDTYTGAGETFPILVQKDDITIRAEGDVTITGEESKAVFAVGALREYDEATHTYVIKRVSGVTIQGFTIGDPDDTVTEDIGIVVKDADNVQILENEIVGTIEGIRLFRAQGCYVAGNIVTDAQGIGIFLEQSHTNVLEENTVTGCALGLFLFKSNYNSVTFCDFSDNDYGGVVVNDSNQNLLGVLDVQDNGGWGIRFIHSDGNALAASTIAYNTVGGVELAGAQDNSIGGEWTIPAAMTLSAQQLSAVAEQVDQVVMLLGNVIVSNGDPTEDYDDPQIVITKGDKAIFENDVFSDYNDLADLSDFVEEKLEIYEKLELLEWWIVEIDYELWEIRQKIASAIGAIDQQQTPSALIQSAIDEKHFIDADDPPIQRSECPEDRPAALEDRAHNFTLEDAEEVFDDVWALISVDKLDFYEDGEVDDFGLDRNGPDDDPGTGDDEISWDKLSIVGILLDAIWHEIWNDFSTSWRGENLPDSLKEKLDWLLARGLITQKDKDALVEKLDAIGGFVDQIRGIIDEMEDKLTDPDNVDADDDVDELLTEANGLLEGAPDQAKEKLLEAKELIEGTIEIKQEIYELILDIRYKLCLVDLELPPFPRVNSVFIGKKEKPFAEISGAEIDSVKDEIVTGLNTDTTAKAIREAVKGTGQGTFVSNDISGDHVGLRASTDNVIANNIITSDLPNPCARNVGIIIDGWGNKIVNNLFTNEWIPELDQVLRNITAEDITEPYKENLRLDVAILLYGDENEIYYNAFEFINTGMERGGERRWKDYQLEYVFEKLALVGYWPGPGYVTPTACGDGSSRRPRVSYDASHFDQHYTDYLPVFSLTSEDATVADTDSIRVKRNLIEANFFEYCGVGIYILDAESNHIEQNLFYHCANGGIVFHGGYMPNIILKHNDYFGGLSVVNMSTLPVSADQDYTPPEGEVGHAPAVGQVSGPATIGGPYAYANFTPEKLQVLLGENLWSVFFDADNPLPPNVLLIWGPAWIEEVITLPEEKPRHPDDIFGRAPAPVTVDLPAGWNMISVPLDPVDPAPVAVFGDDVMPLVIWRWSATAGSYLVPAEVAPERGYWLLVPAGGTTVDVSGAEVTTDRALALGAAGWHQISAPWTYPVAEIRLANGTDTLTWAQAVAAGWVEDAVWAYDPVAGEYVLASQLEPWRGYWIRTLVAGLTMQLLVAEAAPLSATAGLQPMAERVGLSAPPPPPSTPQGAAELVIVNEPNPITDVHTTTFRVLGPMAAMVEEIRVRIFDLSGRLVWEGSADEAELVWHTESLSGRYLANGVYLYQVQVKIGGDWVTTQLKKLAIYR